MRNTVVMIVLAVLAAATWLATWQRQDAAPAVEPAENAGPLGYYLRGARFSVSDEEGRVTYRVSAERLDELPDDLKLQLTGVSVDYSPADDAAWSMSAATATYARDSSQLDLVGNVELRSAPTDGSGVWRILGETLRFSPQTSKAESQDRVEIHVGDWKFTGGGLRLDLKGKTLALESEVHGTPVL